jgi:hypothetical protein
MGELLADSERAKKSRRGQGYRADLEAAGEPGGRNIHAEFDAAESAAV